MLFYTLSTAPEVASEVVMFVTGTLCLLPLCVAPTPKGEGQPESWLDGHQA